MSAENIEIEGLSEYEIVTCLRTGSKGKLLRELNNGNAEVQIIKDHAHHKKNEIVIWRKWR